MKIISQENVWIRCVVEENNGEKFHCDVKFDNGKIIDYGVSGEIGTYPNESQEKEIVSFLQETFGK